MLYNLSIADGRSTEAILHKNSNLIPPRCFRPVN